MAVNRSSEQIQKKWHHFLQCQYFLKIRNKWHNLGYDWLLFQGSPSAENEIGLSCAVLIQFDGIRHDVGGYSKEMNELFHRSTLTREKHSMSQEKHNNRIVPAVTTAHEPCSYSPVASIASLKPINFAQNNLKISQTDFCLGRSNGI